MAVMKERKKAVKSLEKPSLEDLKVEAYYRWLERGKPQGEELDDWLAVENKWKDNIVPIRND